MRPFYDDGTAVIYHGRWEDVLPCLAPVDIAVTSPPYNMGLVPGGNGRGMYRPGASNKAGRFREGYGAHDDAMPQAEYDRWQRDALASLWEKVNLGVFYNHRPRVEHGRVRFPLSMDFGPLTEHLRQVIVWDRGTGIDVNLRQFCTRGEWVLLFAKPEFALVSHSSSGMGDVWALGMETGVPEHPAPFPVSLPGRCIDATGARSVIDPFMGSGSTLRAAKDRGVRAVGIEVEERYCEVAARRLGQESLFTPQGEGNTDE